MVLSVRTRTRTVHLPEHTRAILGHTTGIYKPHGMSHGLSFYNAVRYGSDISEFSFVNGTFIAIPRHRYVNVFISPVFWRLH